MEDKNQNQNEKEKEKENEKNKAIALSEEERKLIEGARAGDDGAFEELLLRYRPLVNSCVDSFVRSTSLERDDLLQEATIALFRAAQTYDTKKKSSKVTFGLYAKICLKNRLTSVARKAKRASAGRKSTSGGAVGGAMEREGGKSTSPEAQFAPDALSLPELLRTLSPLEREIFTLRLSGLSYEEIAKKIKRNEKCVDNALMRIKRKSKKLSD